VAHWLRRGARFEIDEDLRWVLARGLCGDTGVAPPASPERAALLARRLSLAPRIVGRSPWVSLRDDLGQAAARELAVDRALAEARDEQILALVRRVAELEGPPSVLLKFAALRVAGVVERGARHASDLDVLVAERDAEPLARRLERVGFVRSSIPAYEHHLPALAHPEHGMVEIHTVVPGVRLGPRSRRRFARFEDLAQAGVLAPATDFPGVLLPRRALLAAHALAHGVAQHGDAPGSYPALQMLADLGDLGSAALAEGAPWTARDVDPRVARAVGALVESLRRGAIPESGEGRALLDRLLRGALDAGERRSRKLSFARPLSDRPWLVAHAARWRRTLFPSAAELSVLYGPPGRFGGAARQRALRPFDIAWRSLRSLAARGERRRP